MKRIYTLEELEKTPTISSGYTDDLKIETNNHRVWLSRLTVDDGEPCNNKVTVEKLVSGYKSVSREVYAKYGKRGRWESPYWVVSYTYEAK